MNWQCSATPSMIKALEQSANDIVICKQLLDFVGSQDVCRYIFCYFTAKTNKSGNTDIQTFTTLNIYLAS